MKLTFTGYEYLYMFHDVKLCADDMSICTVQHRMRNRKANRIQSLLNSILSIYLQAQNVSGYST